MGVKKSKILYSLAVPDSETAEYTSIYRSPIDPTPLNCQNIYELIK